MFLVGLSVSCRAAGLEIVEPNAAALKKESSKTADAASNPVFDSVWAGDFAAARQSLEKNPTAADPRLGQLEVIVGKQQVLEQSRRVQRQKDVDEQLAEVAKLKDKLKDKIAADAVEPNDVDALLAAVIRVKDHATADSPDMMKDSFVQQMIEKARQNAARFEKEGKWVDAYTHGAYWLTLLYEDDETYKDSAEKLGDLASIELSLKDSTCGEKAVERYEGIEPFMLIRALQALETNYVHPIEYLQMNRKALDRCRLLGQTMAYTQEKLAWSADPDQIAKWNQGLESLQPVQDDKKQPGVKDTVELFDAVLTLNAVSLKLPESVIIAHFAEGALSSLDPFTNLVWPWNVKDFKKSMTQQFSGIGVEISKTTGVLKIGSLLPDSPAYRAGLDADDEIIAVNGEATEPMTIFCAVDKITGPKGTKVQLTIRRPVSNKVWDVTIVRDKIAVAPLRGWQRDADGQWDWIIDPVNRIGYIRMTAFTETSGTDCDKILKTLEKQGLNALILDLRFNSGGYLNVSAEVVDLFVREGVIVKSNPRHGFATYELAHGWGTHPDYPLTVLINEGSASASEIVAGALQDPKHNRAILVGQRSYGKGSVQIVTPYTGGDSQLKYTIAYYHLPSDQQVKSRYQMEKLGRKDWGIAPDVDVEMTGSELRRMLDIQRVNDVLVQANHGDSKTPAKHYSIQETLASDPQLSTALLITQAKLAAEGKTLSFPADPNLVGEVRTASGIKK